MTDPLKPTIEEIQDCMSRNLGVDNVCVRWLLERCRAAEAERDESLRRLALYERRFCEAHAVIDDDEWPDGGVCPYCEAVHQSERAEKALAKSEAVVAALGRVEEDAEDLGRQIATFNAPKLARAFSAGMCSLFKQTGGKNLVEWRVDNDELGPLVMTLQRANGKTPMELHDEQKARVAELQAIVDRLHKAMCGVGAQGYGLNDEQQKAIADLWTWQEQSLRSNIVLGGPMAEATKAADDGEREGASDEPGRAD